MSSQTRKKKNSSSGLTRLKRRKRRPELAEDYLLRKIPRQLYQKQAGPIRDVLRQVAELDARKKSSVRLAISRVRTMLALLDETEFVHICDRLEANGWKPVRREND